MRGLTARERKFLEECAAPYDILDDDEDDEATFDALEARGLIAADADDAYWATPLGRLMLTIPGVTS